MKWYTKCLCKVWMLDWVGSPRFGIIICSIPSVKNSNYMLGLAFSKICSDCEPKGKLSGISRGPSGLAKEQMAIERS